MDDGVPTHHHHHLEDAEFSAEDVVPVEAPLAGLGAKTITFLGACSLQSRAPCTESRLAERWLGSRRWGQRCACAERLTPPQAASR